MRPLLLTAYGTRLKTKNRKIVLLNQDTGERREWLPSEFGYDAVIVENLGGFVTFPALRWLASNGISLTALGFDGEVLGQWLPEAPTNGPLRLAQLRAHLSPRERLRVARWVLKQKLGRNVHETARTIQDLLLIEAQEADRYWSRLGVRRDYPHARDPVNACLNYSYGLLYSRARVSIHRVGLDPTVGFLHVPRADSQALVYDWVEAFRDRTNQIALAFEKHHKSSHNFREIFGHGLTLREPAAKELVKLFAARWDDREADNFTRRMALQFCDRDSLARPTADTEPSLLF
jgi:CRISPR/Cas system-associated endonuclease Cas1